MREYTKVPGYEDMTQPQARYNYLHDLLEKCQDIINYVVFIWCCGNEEMEKNETSVFLYPSETASSDGN